MQLSDFFKCADPDADRPVIHAHDPKTGLWFPSIHSERDDTKPMAWPNSEKTLTELDWTVERVPWTCFFIINGWSEERRWRFNPVDPGVLPRLNGHWWWSPDRADRRRVWHLVKSEAHPGEVFYIILDGPGRGTWPHAPGTETTSRSSWVKLISTPESYLSAGMWIPAFTPNL